MNGDNYKLGYKQALQNLAVQRYAMLGLVLLALLLAILAFGNKERVIVTLPQQTEQFEIGFNSANAAYHKHYGLYVATLLGNVNPDNASFIQEALSLAFSPELYENMQQRIAESASKMRLNGRSTRFYADRVIFEEETSRTFVTGKQELVSPTGNVTEQLVTMEMVVAIESGIPVVQRYANYPGQARTEQWAARNKSLARSE